MKAETISELKKALVRLDQEDLLNAVLRLARFKVENKELLTYLLFMADDEQGYANHLCDEIDELFIGVDRYMHKKTLRKIIRWMNKCLRFSANKETEIQVRIHFCETLNASRIPYHKARVTLNMYNGQIKKIERAAEKLHEDLRSDIERQLKPLR